MLLHLLLALPANSGLKYDQLNCWLAIGSGKLGGLFG